MNIYEMKNRREVCWDEFFIDEKRSVELRMHEPRPRELAVVCNEEWEGIHNGYGCVVKTEDGWNFCYRAFSEDFRADGTLISKKETYCVMESRDGIHFTRPNLGMYSYNGSHFNNIFYMDDTRVVDNFSVFYDENPACPPQERYKALTCDGEDLKLFVSEDGLQFTYKRIVEIPGHFDSCNVVFWDRENEIYRIYARVYYDAVDPSKLSLHDSERSRGPVRSIQLATSKDMVHWENIQRIQFNGDADDLQLYTNNIQPYYRAPHMFIGMPARYLDRSDEAENFEQMPMGERHAFWSKYWGRGGTAVTDCLLMTSRDGLHFDRTDEAFLRPGPESQLNWWYGDCYVAYGMTETPSDVPGAPNEISFYAGEGYRVKSVSWRRYTVRLDGFFSWHAGYKGGEVLTKPFTFEGSTLSINFSTSAIGHLTITLCDENGNALEGYSSGYLFGDSVDRKVRFEKDLALLNGQPVRMKLTLSDCDLYSFCFA